MVDFLDPRAPTAIEQTPYNLALHPGDDKVQIAYLANGFPDSENFLQALSGAVENLVRSDSRHWNKGNASIPAPDSMLEEITGQCQAAIAAYGH